MSRFLTITSSSSVNFGERKKTVNVQSAKVGNITLNFLLAILVCALGVFYIFEVNSLATKGYEIKKLETQVDELTKQNDNLKIQAAEQKSMYNI
jgi:cell division protein FtsL